MWFLLSFFLLSSPILSGHILDVYHTFTHAVTSLRIQNACVKCAARCSLKMQDAKIGQKSPPAHHSTTLSSNIFAIKACIDNRKKIVKQQYLPYVSTIGKYLLNNNISSTYPHNKVNFRPLAAEIDWQVWGTPANFYGFRVLASLQ